MRDEHYYCEECFEKQRKIDVLEAQITRLNAKLRYQERTAKEGLFGISTPSSKIPIKPNSLAERQERHGGGKLGHVGHGRRTLCAIGDDSVCDAQADRVERIRAMITCPACGCSLVHRALRRRTVIDCQPLKVEKKLLELEEKQCPRCGHHVKARAPGVLPKCLYGNQLLSHVATEHYLYGRTLGQIEKQTGIGCSSLIDAMHGLARRLSPVVEILVEEYRKDPVKHADETGWRTDGQNGYAWLFCTQKISVFRLRRSRSAAVAKEVLGEKKLKGALVVDRYNGYNKIRCQIQYCYAHLLRDVKKLSVEFPENQEINEFIETLAPLLASAMHLRALSISNRTFKREAALIKRQIITIAQASARHPAIQSIQSIFREKSHRLYHWAKNRQIPADNNLAERNLRPLVIARKISFGSQSLAGAKTRETLMTVLHSLQKQTPHVTARFKAALDQLAINPNKDPYTLLFNPDSS